MIDFLKQGVQHQHIQCTWNKVIFSQSKTVHRKKAYTPEFTEEQENLISRELSELAKKYAWDNVISAALSQYQRRKFEEKMFFNGLQAMQSEQAVLNVKAKYNASEYFVLTFVNTEYWEAFKLWYHFYERSKQQARCILLVVCMDDKTFNDISEYLQRATCQYIIVKENTGTYAFTQRRLWEMRLAALNGLLTAYNFDIIMSDVDALWISDPVKLIKENKDLSSTDIVAGVGSWPKECSISEGGTICMGFTVIKNSRAARAVINRALTMNSGDDQRDINCAIYKHYIKLSKQVQHTWGLKLFYETASSVKEEISIGLLSNEIVKRNSCSRTNEWSVNVY